VILLDTNLRPLSLGEILDRTFALYRQNFLLFFGITAIPYTLNLALSLFQVWYFGNSSAKGVQAVTEMFTGTHLLFTLLSLIVGCLVYIFSEGGTILAITQLYLGRQTSMSTALRGVWDEFGTLFAVVALNGLAVGAGFIFLIVPGIYLLCRLIVCLPVALVEKLGASESLSRSFQLTRDNAGRAFMILLVFFAVSLAGGAMTGVVLIPITLTHRDPSQLRIVYSASMVLQTLVNSLVAPVLLIASSVFYFDLRIRKEAFDLQFMMNPDSEHITGQQPPGSIL
jgi:hypothetical protein